MSKSLPVKLVNNISCEVLISQPLVSRSGTLPPDRVLGVNNILDEVLSPQLLITKFNTPSLDQYLTYKISHPNP